MYLESLNLQTLPTFQCLEGSVFPEVKKEIYIARTSTLNSAAPRQVGVLGVLLLQNFQTIR